MRRQTNTMKLLKNMCFHTATLAFGLLCVTANAQMRSAFHFKSVDAPGAIYFTGILGINNHGDIAGVRDDIDGHAHGFVRIGYKYTTIDFPGATDTNSLNITDDGDITGVYFDTAGFEHGYLLHKGHYTSIDDPEAAQTTGIDFEFGPGLGTAAYRMNRHKVIVGQYADALGFSHGFWLQYGQYHTLDIPNASHRQGAGSEAIGINDHGVVCGLYYGDSSPLGLGFVLDHGRVTTINHPGAGGTSGTQCNGINNFGVVVGPYSDVNDQIHGYIWRSGTFYPIDYPDAASSESDGINDHGVIVGQYTDAVGFVHGYIATLWD